MSEPKKVRPQAETRPAGKSHEDALPRLIKKDSRYPREAYFFVFEALDYTVRSLPARRHVSGQELLEGIRKFALKQFGGLTMMVFHQWNIRRTEDFGEIVFNLVEAKLMGRTEEDSKEDFKNGYDFEKAFSIR